MLPSQEPIQLYDLRQIIDSSMDCIKVLDLQGRLLAMSQKGQSLLEIDDLAPYLNQSWITLWRGEAREKMAEAVAQARAGGKGRFQTFASTPKGTPKWWDMIVTPICDAEGRPERLLAITRDITELKQAEAELEQSRYRFQALSEATFEGAVISEGGRIVDTNEQYAHIMGYSREELIGKEIVSFFAPEDRERVLANIVAGREAILEHRLYRKDGRLIIVEAHGKPALYQGRPARISAIRDITARKQAEDALRLRNERLALLSQAAAHLLKAENPDSLLQELFDLVAAQLGLDAYLNFMIDADGRGLHLASSAGISDAAARSFARVALGQHICGTVAQARVPFHATFIQQTTDEKTLELKKLGYRAYIGFPLLAGDRLLGTLGFCSRSKDHFDPDEADLLSTIVQYVAAVKERLRLEDALHGHIAQLASANHQLAVANEQLAEADRRKDQFLAMLAHELRNPLAPIRNAVQVLRLMGETGSAQQRQREIIDRQVGHMARLLDDLLDVSRITSGKIELHLLALPLADVLDHAVETAMPLIEARRHTLAVTQPPPALRVSADLDRLAQVVVNLLANAAKYTHEGGRIWLEARREEGAAAGDPAWAAVTVRDNGMGIEPEMLPHVFEIFTQADRSLASSQGGLGLGLTLARSLAQMHGGTLTAASPGPGQGSEFTLRLPALAAAPAPAAPASENGGAPAPAAHAGEDGGAAASPRRILVVEDVVDSAESLAQVLELWGHEARTAYDGPSALDQARIFLPEIVLLDLGLPGMSGFEVARRLRESMRGWSIRLVALTGYGNESDRKKAAEAGFDEHLVKPVDLNALREFLAHSPVRKS